MTPRRWAPLVVGVLIAALVAVLLIGRGSRDQTGAYVETINAGLEELGENCEPFPSVGRLTTEQLRGRVPKMRDFERVGLLKAERYYSEYGRAAGFTTGYDVRLTSLGERYYRPGEGFCYGRGVVTRLLNVVPNEETRDVEVTYEYKLEPFPDWAGKVGIDELYEASVVLRPTRGGRYVVSDAVDSP
ncbi:hypothetical protein [Deinococcus budaensis]|uniref:Uncharacterized protein n=1 Tax=Deinococcus budaensis TaxID=1665626 RepID=A0A7W8GIB0_9DEIO|nr:hypothetical protein [Deinococcus budaensis]MBB5235993.1 hypothetical protein [Deinococcus budaensis]